MADRAFNTLELEYNTFRQISYEFINRTQEYYELVKGKIRSNSSSIFQRLNDMIEESLQLLNNTKIKNGSLTLTLDLLFHANNYIQVLVELMNEIYFLLHEKRYLNSAILSASHTRSQQIQLYYESMERRYDRYQNQKKCLDDLIYDSILLVQLPKMEDVIALYEKYTKSVNIFKYIARIKLERNEDVQVIKNNLDDIKINSIKCEKEIKSRDHIIKDLLTCKKLVPKGEFKLLGEYITLDEIKAGKKVVILRKTSKSPIYFDIRGLIDYDYIYNNELISPDLAGLNSKMIKRFSTIKELPHCNPDEETNKVYEYLESIKCDDHKDTILSNLAGNEPYDMSIMILETFNGCLFRELSFPDLSAGTFSKDIGIISDYNRRLENAIFVWCKKDNTSTKRISERHVSKQTPEFKEKFKKKLVDKIVLFYKPYIREINNGDEFKKRLQDKKLMEEAMVSAMDFTIDKYETDSVKFEIMSTYLNNLQEIFKHSERQVMRLAKEIYPDDKLFVDYKSQREYLDRKMLDMVEKIYSIALFTVNKNSSVLMNYNISPKLLELSSIISGKFA